jgi:hypothetical protein
VHPMQSEQLLWESNALLQWLDEQIDGVEFNSEVRVLLAASCFELTLEHQKAIVILVSQSLYGSAFALVRVIFEAYVRGVWLYRCASDAGLELFMNDKLSQKKGIGQLIGDLERLPGFNKEVLSKVKTEWFGAMSSYTHSGYLAARRRLSEGAITPNYAEDQITEVLRWANALGMMAAIELAQIVGNHVLAQTLLDKFKEM